MKIILASFILSFVFNSIVAEVNEGECQNLTRGEKSWTEICSAIQTYCILENNEPTCKCDNDMEFSSDEGRCIETTLCEEGDSGFSECQDKNGICIKMHNEKFGYKCKCPKGSEMTIEEKCEEIDYCSPNAVGFLTCLGKGYCKTDNNNEKGFYCICNDGKICEESTENLIVNRATTFSDEFSSLSTVSQDEVSYSFSTNNTETTMPDSNTLSEKSDFSTATSTHLSEETLTESSPVTVETSTNPSILSSTIIKKDDNLSIKETRSSTESSSTDGVNEVDSTKPDLEKSYIIFIVGTVFGVVIFVIILAGLLILRKKCHKNENCSLKVEENYEKKLGALTPTFILNENKKITKVPEKTVIIPLSV